MTQSYYLCIDLKSFYASVECVERGLDPMTTDLVVADPERTDKTICLAVSPSLKAKGVKNRCRVFEIPKGLDYIMAPPQMQKYIDYAAEIYGVYLEYIAPEDIHVYSIDEAFLDVTHYLWLYDMTPKQLAIKLMDEVYKKVGVRATCGIGTNLYLSKIALDITAKHSADFIGFLDEDTFKKTMWRHKPLTDFWRIGRGTAERLAKYGIFTMEDIATAPEDLLYKWFGIDAELLIDHAWGRECTTIKDIKSYRAKTNCLASGQVLMRDYSFLEARLIVKEMVDLLCLDMVSKNLVTDSVTLYVGYSNTLDVHGAHGTAAISKQTNADSVIIPAVTSLYDRIVNREYPVRRINLTANRVVADSGAEQLSVFDNDDTVKNKVIQETMLKIKSRYGKNAILKGMNFQEAATTRERNQQIGGHKAGGQNSGKNAQKPTGKAVRTL
ncbi:MAG: DNA repair protein [Ruminococcaceae bacterium]|nr:DNA repair protein [Oscillospiraceae bacterium]